MKIYLKFNAESEKYASMVATALRKAGHGVFDRSQFREEKEALQACHVIINLTAGNIAEAAKPAPAPILRKDTDARVQKLVLVLGKKVLPRRQLVAELGLKQKSRRDFTYNYMKPTFERGFIEMAYPGVPNKPEQAYKLTAKGLDLYAKLTGDKE